MQQLKLLDDKHVAEAIKESWRRKLEEEGEQPEDAEHDAAILAEATYTATIAHGNPVQAALERLPAIITKLQNPAKYLKTRAARRRTPSLLEKTRTIYLGILQELNLHGAPIAPAETRKNGLKIQYTRILRCPQCSSKTKTRITINDGEIIITQECTNCSYKHTTRIPAPSQPYR